MLREASGFRLFPDQTIPLPYSDQLPAPKVVLRAPLQHVSCLDLFLDATMSLDSLGPLTLEWSCFDCISSSVQSLLEASKEASLTIPSLFLLAGNKYSFRFVAVNSWGVSATVAVEVGIISGESIFVSLSEEGGRVVISESAVLVTAFLSVLQCNQKLSPIHTVPQFNWLLSDATGQKLGESLEAIFILEPRKLKSVLSETVPLNLSVTVTSAGYASGFASMLVLKASVLSISTWLDLIPASLTLPIGT